MIRMPGASRDAGRTSRASATQVVISQNVSVV